MVTLSVYPTLLTPCVLNTILTLNNRIVMAPMTRNMAHDDLSPTDDMVRYYAKRAKAGLIITEGTIIEFDARGYSHTPGIYTEKQIAHWKKVTDAVHQNGGRIFCQLWHVGRVSHPDYLNGKLPISASDKGMIGKLSRSDLTYVNPRIATEAEIQQVVLTFQTAAKNALLAGFDGIEIHGANGYLIDQFLHYDTNTRTDHFGGTPANMARFPLAVVDACCDAIGRERVGIRLSPGAYLHQINGDRRDAALFSYLLTALSKLSIAYVHTGNMDDAVTFKELNNQTMTQFIRDNYQGTLIAAGNYTMQQAETDLSNNKFDLVSMGRPFIANPDLIEKVEKNRMLVPFDGEMLATLS